MSEQVEREDVTQKLLAFVGGALIACVAGTAFAFTTFQTKADYENRRNEGLARLARLEEKIDRVLDKVSTIEQLSRNSRETNRRQSNAD